MKAKLKASGFTLVELLVVITIIGMLVALLLPSLSKARESAKLVKCAAQQRSIGQYCFLYATDFRDKLPERGSGYSFPTYPAMGGAFYQNAAGFVLANYILETNRMSAVMPPEGRISFVSFLWDYCELKNHDMWITQLGGYDRYEGFLKPNTVMHCPSISSQIPINETMNIGSNPNPYISYAFIGFTSPCNGGDGYQNGIALGYPQISRMNSFEIPGSGIARPALLVDVFNHPDSGNITNTDGSVVRFSYQDGYVATGWAGGNFYLPAGYTYIKWGVFNNGEYGYADYDDPYTLLNVMETGASAAPRLASFGYTSPGK